MTLYIESLYPNHKTEHTATEAKDSFFKPCVHVYVRECVYVCVWMCVLVAFSNLIFAMAAATSAYSLQFLPVESSLMSTTSTHRSSEFTALIWES